MLTIPFRVGLCGLWFEQLIAKDLSRLLIHQQAAKVSRLLG